MKTTIELSPGLFKQAKALAQRERTTLRALVEAGLRLVIKQHRERGSFTLRDASFRGRGVQAGFRDERWDQVRDAIYEGRGT